MTRTRRAVLGAALAAAVWVEMPPTWADTDLFKWEMAPRLEIIHGSKEILAQRLVTGGGLGFHGETWQVRASGFFDLEGAPADQRVARRISQFSSYLQEAFLEWRPDPFFLRLGRQPLRWSESWTLPSLDLWTGRKWNRLLFDPLADQLTHSTGLNIAWAWESWHIEGVLLPEVATSHFPEPLTDSTQPSDGLSSGLRLKKDFNGLAASLLAGNVGEGEKEFFGGSLNYATDYAVPKLELGRILDRTRDVSLAGETTNFASLGLDFFWEDWTLQPQLTFSQVHDRFSGVLSSRTLLYFSGSWRAARHQVSWQLLHRTDIKEFYGSLEYLYEVDSLQSAGGFVKTYGGDRNSPLFAAYEQITGEWSTGINYALSF